MSIDFVAFDFETANYERASACSIGMVKVVNGNIVDTFYSLINPETNFDYYNVWIHGITKEMVANKPTYPNLISQISHFIDGFPLVAHYAPFDIGVIRDSNERYGIHDFEARYFDSYFLSRHYIKSINYKLNHLSEQIGIPFVHHDALEDARACALIIKYLCDFNNFSSIDELLKNANYPHFGVINGIDRKAFTKRSIRHTYSSFEIPSATNTEKLDPEHIFYKKQACFTGTLQSMNRLEAMTLFANVGGKPEKGVTKKTNFLVMGDQDLRVVGETGKSSKIKKAEQYLKDGQDIQFLSEEDFLRMI